MGRRKQAAKIWGRGQWKWCLMGTGGCAAFDVVLILKKSRQDISDCVVEIEAKRAPHEPKVFTHIHFHFILSGRNLNSAQVERAIKLSAEKYCSASIMLAKTAELTHDFEIVEMNKLFVKPSKRSES